MSIISQAELPASVHSAICKVHFAKFGNEKGNLLFSQNFYIILPRFWQAAQQLEPLCSQACQNIIFKFQNSKDNEGQKFKFIGKLSYGCINVEDMGNASRRPPSTFT
jgi:hypothetical protein